MIIIASLTFLGNIGSRIGASANSIQSCLHMAGCCTRSNTYTNQFPDALQFQGLLPVEFPAGALLGLTAQISLKMGTQSLNMHVYRSCTCGALYTAIASLALCNVSRPVSFCNQLKRQCCTGHVAVLSGPFDVSSACHHRLMQAL